MKTFDWDEAVKVNGAEMLLFLKSVHDVKMDEDEFVKKSQEFRATSKQTRSFNPSKMRARYRALSNKFGFFQ